MAGDRHGILVDVRTPVEYREVHVTGSRNVPLDRLDDSTLQSIFQQANGGPVYFICRTGNRAAKACEIARAAGVEEAINVAGGSVAWEQKGLPVDRGKKAMSLERQVRIVAGSLVFAGSLLAWLVTPFFLILPAFIGTGLVFAGVTDTCGMGMMLARMPWNRVETSDSPNNYRAA
ncbi:MAG: rhodanese-like domain-containing protein [Planctomycetota bacterium]